MPDIDLYQQNPLSLIYNGVIAGILDDEYIKSLLDNEVVFLDFASLPESPAIVNPNVPARDMPRVSLMQESVLWASNNSCSGRLDYTLNVIIRGYTSHSILFNPLVFHFMRVIRKIDTYLRPLTFEEKPLGTVSRLGQASFEHDDEALWLTCTIPIEIQLYI